ncbi:MAG TPA: HAMP domain-containing sensor histidine kinase [Actinomycetes bacterium]
MRPAWFRPTVRLKLTLLYGALFLLAGAGLLAVNYALVHARFTYRQAVVVNLNQAGPAQDLPGPGGAAVFDQPVTPGGSTLGDVIQDVRRDVEAKAQRELLTQSGIALALMTLVSIGLGWVVAGRVLHPLQEITATAKRLSGRNLHERINLDGPEDELKELADTFDRMLARLDAAFDGQRRFVANASHELRTPLTIVRTEVDVALANRRSSAEDLRAMAERVRDAAGRCERLIDGLLTLARSERELHARDPVDLAEAAGEALAHARREAEPLRLSLAATLEPAPVAGDEALLGRLVANLVENAVRHNRPGGNLTVVTGSNGRAFVRVANSGERIPPDQVATLFEPFHRLAGRARTPPRRAGGSGEGSGLGLSIVRAVALAHGGEVDATALPDGGLEVVVSLPASD